MAKGRDSSKDEAGLSTIHRLVALRARVPALLGLLISPLVLAGCNQTTGSITTASLTESLKPGFLNSRTYGYNGNDRECLERAMFFESNRSSRDGMIAVGTVVMNRLRSGQHGDTICSVVGEPRQFAPGVLTRSMNSRAMPDVQEAAQAVLKGERSPKLKNAMHFHTAGLKFPYKNMHYVEVAGGNAFYEKRGRNWQPLPSDGMTMVALNGSTPSARTAAMPTMMAAAQPLPGVGASDTAATSAVQLAAAAPLPTPRAQTPATSAQTANGTQDKAVQVAMQEPSPARFGASDFDTTPVSSIPFKTASGTGDEDRSSLAFQSTPDDTSSVAALIVSENQPQY